MDMFSTKVPTEERAMIRGHIEALRRKPHLVNVPIIVIPENQTGKFHRAVEENVSGMVNCYVVHEGGGAKPGIAKTQGKTADYVLRTRAALYEDLLTFEKEWVTVTGHVKNRGRAGILKEMKQQLMRFGFDEKRTKLTGKHGAHQDDGAIAFMMLIYWAGAISRPAPGNPYRNQFPVIFGR